MSNGNTSGLDIKSDELPLSTDCVASLSLSTPPPPPPPPPTTTTTTTTTTQAQTQTQTQTQTLTQTQTQSQLQTTTPTNNQQTDNVGPMTKPRPKPRPVPYSKSILLSADRRQRKKKTITWQPDDQMTKVHYFELIADERVNVSKQAQLDPTNPAHASFQQAAIAATSPNAHANRLNPLGGSRLSSQIGDAADPLSRQRANLAANRSIIESNEMTYREWKAIPIDFNPELPSPGWNSVERSAQAEREMYVLSAIDLPGQPSTIDEPEGHTGNGVGCGGNGGAGGEDEESSVKIIPLDNPNGMYTEYPDINSQQISCWPSISAGGALFQAWAPQLDDLSRLNVL